MQLEQQQQQPPTPQTPKGRFFDLLLFDLNTKYALNLPIDSQDTAYQASSTREDEEFCVKNLRFLYWKLPRQDGQRGGGAECPVALERIIREFEDKVVDLRRKWVPKPRQEPDTLVVRQSGDTGSFLRTGGLLEARNETERTLFLKNLRDLLYPEAALAQEMIQMQQSCSSTTDTARTHASPSTTSYKVVVTPGRQQQQQRQQPKQSPSKRRLNQQQVFQTAPSSLPPPRCMPCNTSNCSPGSDSAPTPAASSTSSLSSPSSPFRHSRPNDDDGEFDDPDLDSSLLTLTDSIVDNNQPSPRKGKQRKIDGYFPIKNTGNTPTNNGSASASASYDGNGMPPPPKQPDFGVAKNRQQPTVNTFMRESKPNVLPPNRYSKSVARSMVTEDTSFSTTASSDITGFSLNGADRSSTVATTLTDDDFHTKSLEDVTEEELQTSSAAAFEALVTGMPEPEPEPELDPKELKVRELVRELEENGPLAKKGAFHSTLPLRHRYEAQRIANAREVPLAEALPRGALPCQSYDEFWKSLKGSNKSVVEKTKAGPWEMAVDQYQDTKTKTDDVVTLSGKLEWDEKSEPKFKLNPLRFERGYRFCRRFGSDRFLEVTFPVLQQVPQYYVKRGYDAGVVLRGIARWLATSNHYIAGRVWRGFFLEEVKKKKAEVKESKVYMFAVDGDDFLRTPHSISPAGESADRHTPMNVKSLINWHIPLAENLKQNDCKLFQRLPLGLSRTLPTVTLLAEETIAIESPPGKEIMNDGCALMSRSLAISIADHLGISTTPSCFQGRIAGAKGIWMVARDDNEFEAGDRNYWIQISRDSQLKIEPHPQDRRIRLDEEQLTFEVVSWSRPLHPANLNMQLLMILQHGGVRRDHLEDLIEREITQFYKEFTDIITRGSGVACRRWLQTVGYDESAKKRKTRRIDGFPASHMEQAILLLEHGFLPLQLPYLTFLFDSFLKEQLTKLDELKIRISQSTYAYCIADPYGILKEDEIHFAFSKSWEEHGYYGAELDEVDVLVGRLPAHKPCDVQRRRAVYKKELRHFRDVMVFPTTGDIPLASMLSGGDYDGDEPWICWDPNIVNAFRNTEFRKDDFTPSSELGLVSHSTSMKEYDKHPSGFDDFLAKMFGFSSIPSQLGLCTVQHEKLCYAKNRIDSAQAMKLADLLGNLVDAPKAGLELTPTRWRDLRTQFGLNGLQEPAYKARSFNDSRDSSFRDSFRGSSSATQQPNMDNIIDYLRFKVIEKQCERIKLDFSRLCKVEERPAVDTDLLAVWTAVWDEGITELRAGRPALKDALLSIQGAVKQTHTTWLREIGSRPGRSPYHEMIDRATELLEEVRPPQLPPSTPEAGSGSRSGSESGSDAQSAPDSALRAWVDTWKRSEESWVALRASCAYKSNGQKFPWYAAGPTLCLIKAKAVAAASGTPFRAVVWDVYRSLRVHGKAARRLEEEALRGAEDGAEESGSEDEEDVVTMLATNNDEDDDVFVDAREDGGAGDESEGDGGDTEPETDYGEDDWVAYAC